MKHNRMQDQSLFYPGHLWSLESPLPLHPHELVVYLSKAYYGSDHKPGSSECSELSGFSFGALG